MCHTGWGGEFPSIAGHEIVGRIDRSVRSRGEWGVAEGDRVAVRDIVITDDGYRVYGHDFSADEGSGLFGGFAEYLELLPARSCTGSVTIAGRGAHRVRAAELRGDLGGAVRAATSWSSKGPGHMGMATIVAGQGSRCVAGDRHRRGA
jgi:hypothetical protein